MLGYENNLEHLLEELQRIDLVIRLQVLRFRMMGQRDLDEFRGLYLREEDIDAILSGKEDFVTQKESEFSDLKALHEHITALEMKICDKKAETHRRGTALRLVRLKELFQLSSFDIDTLLICLAPELDLRYERLYAYLQDDVTKKRPSVDLVLNLLCPSFEAKLTGRKYFTTGAPLFKHHLLQLFDDPSHQRGPLLNKYLKADERLVEYLLEFDEIDARLLPYVDNTAPQTRLEDLLLSTDFKCRLELLSRGKWDNNQGLILHFQGPQGVGKQTTAEALCRELGVGFLVVDGERLLDIKEVAFETAVRLVTREALLQNASLYWDGFDALLADDKRTQLVALIQELENQRGLIFLAGNIVWEPIDALQDRPFVRIEFPRPKYAERIQLWARSLGGSTPLGSDVDLEALANKFQFSGGQIRDAATTARNLARCRDPGNGSLTMADLHAACRLHSNRKLATLAQKITPHYTWGDIILPPDQLRQLQEICNHVKYRSLVYEEWGFDHKLSLGKGLNVLFGGPSGTGKTMAAEIMANELNLDLYKIDLSTVVSKYIGETEKNLSKIFEEAETSNAILFFDEADALFGKRSEVKDSHDRYANIEISYLLQKMDEYIGVVILATNLRKNMDEAFVRRMHFTVEFPFPEENYRLLIWQNIFPRETPLNTGVDFNFLAHKFKFSGGNIKNVALTSALYAASDGRAVTMEHLVLATKRELQKMGELCVKTDFGEYCELLQ